MPIYNSLYPSKTQIPRVHGQPKIQKPENPLREVVDSNGGITRTTNGHISTIIKKYTEDNKYSIKSSKNLLTKSKISS